MTLLEIRKQFVSVSGRYDLVKDTVDFIDNGANIYIQQGQKYLERKTSIAQTFGKYFIDILVNDYKIEFQNCRSIHEVWVMDNSNRTKLIKSDPTTIRGTDPVTGYNNYTTPFSQMNPGRPSYYYPAMLRRVPVNGDFSSDSDTLQSYLDTSSVYNPNYNGIILLPPADKSYALEVIGLFDSIMLSIDTDTNVWTDMYPQILMMSALRQLEIMFRGSKSVSAWDNSIAHELLDIEKDIVDQESTGITQMEG